MTSVVELCVNGGPNVPEDSFHGAGSSALKLLAGGAESDGL